MRLPIVQQDLKYSVIDQLVVVEVAMDFFSGFHTSGLGVQLLLDKFL